MAEVVGPPGRHRLNLSLGQRGFACSVAGTVDRPNVARVGQGRSDRDSGPTGPGDEQPTTYSGLELFEMTAQRRNEFWMCGHEPGVLMTAVFKPALPRGGDECPGLDRIHHHRPVDDVGCLRRLPARSLEWVSQKQLQFDGVLEDAVQRRPLPCERRRRSPRAILSKSQPVQRRPEPSGICHVLKQRSVPLQPGERRAELDRDGALSGWDIERPR